MIKKFKNGNLLLEPHNFYDYEDGKVSENFYHHDMHMLDLYIVQINGYAYLHDTNRNMLYDLHTMPYYNGLNSSLYNLLDNLQAYKKIKLSPLSKKESKDLLQDLENGY